MNAILNKVLICTVVFALLAGVTSSTVKANDLSSMYMELISISVECTDASLNLVCQLISENETLIHYPTEVDMNDPHLVECLNIMVMFNTTWSVLTFSFNGTDKVAAKTNADAVKTSMNTAFDVTFTHFNTTPFAGPPPFVSVVYTAGGVGDIVSLTGTLKTDCLASGLGGFSEVLESLVDQSADSMVGLLAANLTEAWGYSFMAMYNTTIPTGSADHIIDVLDLLGASALGPSPYAEMEGTYMFSTVGLYVNSSTDITFVSCVPDETVIPFSRGWNVPSHGPDTTLSGSFYYGTNPTPVEALTFTFSGTVVPEFSTFTLLLTLASIGSAILLLKKRSVFH